VNKRIGEGKRRIQSLEQTMLFRQLFDQETGTFTYLIADEQSGDAILIDPVSTGVDRDLQLISELGLELVYTLDTHIHADHITGSGELRKRTGAISGVAATANVPCVDRDLAHADRLRFGRYEIEVRSTPGHTDGCLTFVLETESQTLAFTGDALLIRGCGRTDFQQGSAATLYQSVHNQIFTLPDDTMIYPGHDYNGNTSSTVKEEKAHNPRIKMSVSISQFMETMDNLDLAPPKRIRESLPANLKCGFGPDNHENSVDTHSYKSITADNLALFSNGLVIDVRSPAEFHSGCLPNAILAPLPELKQHANHFHRDTAILVVCWSGKRSAKGCTLLWQMGFTNITNLSGGLQSVLHNMEATQ
jgi:sulfur dioxygenase